MEIMRGDSAPCFDVRLNSNPTYWHCEPGWEWRSRPLTDHLLWYVMNGRGMLQVDEQTWSLQPGSCFVFRPAAQPHGRQDPERRLVVFGMHFSVVDLQGDPLPETKGRLPPYGHTVRDTAFFAELAQHCDSSWRRGDTLGAQQGALFLRAMILHVWEEVLHPAPSAVDRALAEIVQAIRRTPSERWRVDELASSVHLSRAQFARRFRTLTGMSPVRFIVHARLERAHQLILETNMPVGQIAAALGYDDVAFFSRQYKAYAGHAPSIVRRSSA